jgi:phosphoglucomutase
LAGQEQIRSIMNGLRVADFSRSGSYLGNLPVKDFCDYLATENRKTELPVSDVLYWHMGGPLDCDWICARPSGTEPKLKIYMGAYGPSADEAAEQLARYREAIVTLIESML